MTNTSKTIASVGVVGLLVVALGLWWFFSGDEPEEVSLDAATAGLEESETTDETDTADEADDAATTDDGDADEGDSGAEAATGDENPAAALTDLTGTWNVDNESGEFDYESATGSFVGFRIEEELSTIGSTTAVGRTGDVTGSLTVDGLTVTEATFTADLSTLTTNESRRDGAVQRALDTAQFPTATFTLTEPIELPEGMVDGQAISVEATGELTIHGITQPFTIPLEAQLVDQTAVVVGSTGIVFADFGVEVPSAPVVLSVEDNGPLEMQLLFTRS